MLRSGILLLILASLLVNSGVFDKAGGRQEAYTLLRRHSTFSESDLSSLDTGKVITDTPRAGRQEEIAVLAAALLNVPREFVVNRWTDPRRNAHYRQAGIFSAHPHVGDLRQLSLDVQDFIDLRECRTDACELRILPAEIERLHREIEWSGSDSRLRAGIFLHEVLIDRIHAYRGGHDAEAFRSLFAGLPCLSDYAPEFRKYLEDYPASPLHGVMELFFWSKEDLDSESIVRLTHQSIYRRPSSVMIASKDFYASRQFAASAGLTFLFEETGTVRNPQTYLIYFNRARVDTPGDGPGWLEKALLRGRLNHNTRESIESNKRKIEAEYYAQPMIRK